jgi:hypothetical protein
MEDEKNIQDSEVVEEQDTRNIENPDDSEQNAVVNPAEGGGDVIIIK